MDKTSRKTRKEKKLEMARVEKAMREMESVNRRLKFNRMCDEIRKHGMVEELGQEIIVFSIENTGDWIDRLSQKCDGKE